MKFSLLASLLALTAGALAREGKATYYYQNNTPGSCGVVHLDSDFIVARSPHSDLRCGQTVQITNIGGRFRNHGAGRTITALVADTCPADECDANHLDLSIGAFTALSGGMLDPPGAINIAWN